MRISNLVRMSVVAGAMSLLAGCQHVGSPFDGPESSGAIDPFFGLNGLTPFHYHVSPDPAVREQTFEELQRRLERMQELGVRTARVDFWWSVIEPRPGVFEWEFPDRVIEAITEAGIEPFPILSYNAAWSPDKSPADDEARAAFGEYVYQVVRRYADSVTYWEVWNEPNITPYWVPHPDPEQYGKLLEVVYTRGKEANPRAQFVGMCTANLDEDFIDAAYLAGGRGNMDALSFHFYDSTPDEGRIEEDIRKVRQLMERFGDGDKELWITESGISTGKSDVVEESTPEEQAAWLVKRHLVSRAEGVERFYYYKLQDDKPDPEPDGRWGIHEWTGEEKLSHTAYDTMLRMTGAASFVGRVHFPPVRADDGENLIEFQVYESNGGPVAVAWMRKDGPPEVLSFAAAGDVTLIDHLGNRLDQGSHYRDGWTSVELGPDPIYILGAGEPLLDLLSLRMKPEVVFLPAGGESIVHIEHPSMSGLERRELFRGILNTLDRLGVTASLDVESDTSASVRMVRDPRSLPFPYTRVPVVGPGGFGAVLHLYHAESTATSIQLSMPEEESRLTGDVLLRNLLPQPLSGTMRPAGWPELEGVEPLTVSLPPGEGESFKFSLPAPPGPGEWTFEPLLETEEAKVPTDTFRLAVVPHFGDRMPDGWWRGVPPITLVPSRNQAEPDVARQLLPDEDFGGAIHLAFTSSHLYIRANIKDPTPMLNPYPLGGLWQGDALEVFLSFSGPTAGRPGYGEGDFQIGLSPGLRGENPFVYNWRPREGGGGRLVAGAEIVSGHIPRGYYMEASIPLSEFGATVERGAAIGLDLNLSFRGSLDDAAREGLLIWNGTPRNFLIPARWGIALIETD